MKVRRYHFYILRNCGEVVKRIFELAMRNDAEIRYCLTLMLANLAGNIDNHEFIATHIEMGRLSILVGYGTILPANYYAAAAEHKAAAVDATTKKRRASRSPPFPAWPSPNETPSVLSRVVC